MAKSKGKKKHRKRGCGKKGWRRGGNARWKCKPGIKKHYYGARKSKKRKSKKGYKRSKSRR